jgi:hypothetical protein
MPADGALMPKGSYIGTDVPIPPCEGCEQQKRCRDLQLACAAFHRYISPVAGSSERKPSKRMFLRIQRA